MVFCKVWHDSPKGPRGKTATTGHDAHGSNPRRAASDRTISSPEWPDPRASSSPEWPDPQGQYGGIQHRHGLVTIAGAYVDDGMPPVPAKLAAIIRRWEFVKIGELLPEFWAGPKEKEEVMAYMGIIVRVSQDYKGTQTQTWENSCAAWSQLSSLWPGRSLLS